MQRCKGKRKYFFEKKRRRMSPYDICDNVSRARKSPNMTQCHTILTRLAVKSATKAEYDKRETSKTLWHALCLILAEAAAKRLQTNTINNK